MFFLFFDFITKAYVFHLIPFSHNIKYPYGGIGVFQNFLGIDCSIALTFNKGAAWGIFSDFQLLLLGVRCIVILGMILYLFFWNRNPWVDVSFTLIITGAIGNVVDFFLYGTVIDFIHFNFWGYHFPVFNVADTIITTGVFLLFFATLFSKKNKKMVKE